LHFIYWFFLKDFFDVLRGSRRLKWRLDVEFLRNSASRAALSAGGGRANGFGEEKRGICENELAEMRR
jgi:hypothetical protein